MTPMTNSEQTAFDFKYVHGGNKTTSTALIFRFFSPANIGSSFVNFENHKDRNSASVGAQKLRKRAWPGIQGSQGDKSHPGNQGLMILSLPVGGLCDLFSRGKLDVIELLLQWHEVQCLWHGKPVNLA